MSVRNKYKQITHVTHEKKKWIQSISISSNNPFHSFSSSSSSTNHKRKERLEDIEIVCWYLDWTEVPFYLWSIDILRLLFFENFSYTSVRLSRPPRRVVYNFQINQNLNPISRSIWNLSSYNELGHSKVLTIVRSSSYSLARLPTSSISMQPYMRGWFSFCLLFMVMAWHFVWNWIGFGLDWTKANPNESDWIEEVMKWQCNHKRQEQAKEIWSFLNQMSAVYS